MDDRRGREILLESLQAIEPWCLSLQSGSNQRVLAGSQIGGIRTTQKMLDFSAAHGIGAGIETIAADQINDAYERVHASDVRYRLVIDIATLT